MSFFQNLFHDYEGSWILDEFKGYSLNFSVSGNKNKGEAIVCYNSEPYDLSVSGNLTINFAFDKEFKNYAAFTVNVAGVVPGATMASEIRDILNATPAFSDWYTAGIESADNTPAGNGPQRVYIRQRRSKLDFRTYISNTNAELILKFNKFAGINDIPSYFEKDTIANRFNADSNGMLIRLSHSISGNTVANPTVITSVAHGLTTNDVVYIVGSNSTPTINGQRTVTRINDDTFSVPVNVTVAGTTGEWLSTNEKQLLDDVGITYSTMLADWQHLKGRSANFMFTKNTIDGSNRITSQIEWAAGAVAGQLVKRTQYTYTSANTTPTTSIELPYILQTSDLLTP